MKTSDSSRSADRTGSTRREFLAGTSLAALGVTSVLTRGAASLAAATASAAASEGPSEELQDFIYDLEKGTKGWTGPGGSAKEATVAEFPLSQSIADVPMRLDVGGFRELHWHAIAAEWAYVLEGRVRTTVISPDGRTETDDFDTGDIWYFPKGHGHALQCLGDKPCHFLLGFDNGHFSEFGTFSLTHWVSHTSPEVVWRNLCLPVQLVAALPKKELYIGPGKEPSERQPDNINPNTEESQSRHRFRMESMPVSETFAGGWARIVSAKEFPIQTTLTAVRMNIDPGALREMHWHPNADEWQFVMGGPGRVTIFGSHSRVKTMEYGPGQIAFIKQGYGHFVESTGDEPLRLLILFNSATYQEISISQWLAANPPQLVAEHFGLTNEQTALLPMHQLGIIAKNG
jgi:oxalate decarboxylase